MENAYCEIQNKNKILRLFTEEVNEDHLIWHKDYKDRFIKIIGGKNWKLQIENCLPVNLEIDKNYFIPKETFHRIIKGSYNLIIEIEE